MCFDGYNTHCRNEGECYISNIDACKEQLAKKMVNVLGNALLIFLLLNILSGPLTSSSIFLTIKV